MVTINELLRDVSSQHTSETPQLDVQLILAHVMKKTRTWIATHGDAALTPIQLDSAQQAFSRLKAGEPLPYIIGHWEFFGLEFNVTKDVLIPRPETELLVEKAIAYLMQHPGKKTVADVGTGSGAIAVSIAKHIPDAHILATDISPNALSIAKQNANNHNVGRKIDFIECDLLPEKPAIQTHQSKIDLICANLPYIPTSTLHTLPIYGHEPTLALDGGMDGLEIYRKLFEGIPQWIASHGMILIEIESRQGNSAYNLAHNHFPNATINLQTDLAGKDRLIEILY